MRRFPRFETDRPFNVTLYWEDVPIRTLHGRCRVVGQGGMLGRISDQLYLGDVVQVQIPPLVRAYASVRNVRGSDHGFEFLFTDEGQRRAVKRLCDACEDEANC